MERRLGRAASWHKMLATGAALLFFLGACTVSAPEQQAAATFGRAVVALGDYAAQEFPDMRTRAIRLNVERFRFRFPGDESIIKQGGYGDLAGALTPERVSVRVAAANALKSYGTALLTLVRAEDVGSIREAVNRLGGQFRALAANSGGFNQAEAISFNGIVGTLSGLLTSGIKQAALVRIVPAVKPKVDVICTRLGIDLDRSKAGAAAALNIPVTNLLLTAEFNATSTDLETRSRAIAAYALAKETDEHLALVQARGTRAANACLQANADLVRSIVESVGVGSIPNIENFAALVQDLRNAPAMPGSLGMILGN